MWMVIDFAVLYSPYVETKMENYYEQKSVKNNKLRS